MPAEDVPAARRSAPAFAWKPAEGLPPPARPRRLTHVRPTRRTWPAGRAALSAALALSVALAGVGAASLLVRHDSPVMVAVASPERARPGVTSDPAPPVIAPATTRPDPLLVTMRTRVRVASEVGRVRVRLSSPVRGTVRWVLRGPQGRVRDRRTVTVGPRGRDLVVRRLVAGRYRWEVVPTRAGPVRRGAVVVPPPVPPPVLVVSPQVETLPVTPVPPAPPPTSNPPPQAPPRTGEIHHQGAAPAVPPHDPADDIDPADIPDPVDPNP